MAGAGFNELALQYVLADEKSEERVIAEKAAAAIEASTNGRVAVGQWVASINRWIQPADDSTDDFIARAKALSFLASTLEILQQKGFALKAEQIKLLVTFFGSLFASDHRAGVTASAKALRHLTRMGTFQPSLGNDIIQNACKLGDDFKLQTPVTRLELYELFLGLLRDPSVVNDLGHQHGNTCGFMISLLELCRNERDPLNLIKWFATLELFLQNFSSTPEVTSEVFKTFSAYFPISLRASATSSGVTADDLKSAVRSCFAAHHRLANLAVPFLLAKLDQGDAVTVAVKVDILLTLDACLRRYDNPKQSIVPYVDQIWGSLKYEVRNGEIQDTVKATLKVIGSLTTRLDTDELRSFLNSAWRDLADDLSNPTYAAQAGRLLVSIAGANSQSFTAITPQALSHIQSNIKHTSSTSHKQDLLTLLNSILLVRSHLSDSSEFTAAANSMKSLNRLEDERFGDSLFLEVYSPLWQESPSGSSLAEHVGLLQKVMEGLAALVGQKSTDTDLPRRLCSDSICEQIFTWLAKPTISNPIEAQKFTESITDEDTNELLRESAALALRKAVPLYPPAFQQLLLQYLSSIKTAYQLQPIPSDLVSEIRLVANTLCEIGCSEILSTKSRLSYSMLLINTLMEGLLWVLSVQAPSRYWTAFICSIHLVIYESLASRSYKGKKQGPSRTRFITNEWYTEFIERIKNGGAVELDSNRSGDLELMNRTLESLEIDEADIARHTLAYAIWVMSQLYSRFTTAQLCSDRTSGEQGAIKLSEDFSRKDSGNIVQQDVCLHQAALLATTVVRSLSTDEQKSLQLGREAFSLFQPVVTPYEVSSLDDYRTAPLTMGILQGLHPKVIDSAGHITALERLFSVLLDTAAPLSDTTRAALDTILVVLSNRLDVKDRSTLDKKFDIEYALITTFRDLQIRADGSSAYAPILLRAYRSLLHYLAGDISRFVPGELYNALLNSVYSLGPSDIMVGRQLAQNLGLLVSPKECLDIENHAIIKKLSGEWLYYQMVSPHLPNCFPNDPNSVIDERRAVNRAVATFAILKHLKYDHYSGDIERIIRVAIRSLSTFKIGVEMESCLIVLLQTLEVEPEKLKEHLPSLISGLISVYDMARKIARAAEFMVDTENVKAKNREPGQCRKFVLEFFQKLPASYESQDLWPYRHLLLRPLWAACGDPVREIRRTALVTRQTWDNLA
ncbi:Dos2-interacting transcription regulator of RNA-Pol-II-domain-containing protein [Biscogniauxia sp. FL1348]|nr:Dos2-interacting transcription regulator of RNA-Pol-II-domain-containing protein [Biscogniauxia sp. FL1348]